MLSIVRRSTTRSVLFGMTLLMTGNSHNAARQFLTSRMVNRLIAAPSVPLAMRLSSSSSSQLPANRYPSQTVLNTIQTAEAFCFDVDSTVITEEGIDKLADFKGAGQRVAELTARYVSLITYENESS